MNNNYWWETIIAVFGALGGIETIKYLLERRLNIRRARAQAESDDFHVLRETTEFLQQQLQQKEERFLEHTNRMRDLQHSLFEECERRHQAEVELAVFRCENIDCPHRYPPRIPASARNDHPLTRTNTQTQNYENTD